MLHAKQLSIIKAQKLYSVVNVPVAVILKTVPLPWAPPKGVVP
jgi:hypothetical protein